MFENSLQVQEGMMIKINKTALPALGEMAIEQK
jgi:hypothetical protein